MYLPSMSSRTVVYKGMLLAHQVGSYYRDLQDERALSVLMHDLFRSYRDERAGAAQAPPSDGPTYLDHVLEESARASTDEWRRRVEFWKGRLGGTFSASPVLVGDYVFATNESGRTFLFKANPEGFEIARENRIPYVSFVESGRPKIAPSRP